MQHRQWPQDPRQRLLAMRRAVQEDRAQWHQAVGTLRGVVTRRTQVAPRIRAQPYTFLVGAFLVGLALGARR